MLTETTYESGKTVIFNHEDKWFQAFESTNNILSGDYVAAGGTGRQHFWIDKETLRAYVPNAIRHE
ncbi:hypothetical protein [Paenarthrobacter ureafaciens]|uniref:hypothetical protein n=1 Tax=Paenarthrobacter ureafaciens TaxID=37931 RepID=UPI0009ACB3EB|nr:hypothetical protein [Paenarthrobacter ureafaciens]GLU61578.1 hypothetical protein Pure01_40910 [Paenarthrobacter ureafaciens]GLU65843.1 hypothetical protein Pure02_40930 [Paenarthrobacter ureafaciens]GLU70165.1 hypothetical protein Pure03_41410 [Paenarthrobacter ureafaciens]GLU74399.1 hypothetical protein Pure04_41140 [Paenarthrobacter ureafaciens]GLU78639.1 hypothetical protein Pure05_40790 [Paenarthrobacter ureafaciens]